MVEMWKETTLIEKIIICILFVIVAVIIIATVWGITGSVENEKNRINEGVVIDKDYNKPFTTYNIIKFGDTNIPQPVYHSASYKLEIQGQKDGETVEYWVECTAEEYQQYKMGDYYKK